MKLSEFNQIIQHPMVRAKEEVVEGISYTIISYMVSTPDLWKLPLATECRGITFDHDGKIVSRPFEKFHNVGEKPETMPNLVEKEFVECYAKRDGSMLTPILTKDHQLIFKTKKSFYSDVAKLATQLVPDCVHAFCVYCIHYDLTPIFEFTHPDTRIVLDYPVEENFTLLAIRCNKTGLYESYESMLNLVELFKGVAVIDRYDMTWEQIQESVKNSTGIEGYVLLLKDGSRVKYKTQWYLKMHRIMTDIRERDIAAMVVDETVDDLKSLLTSEGKSLDPILDIENRVESELNNLKHMTEIMSHNPTGEWQVKDFAIQYKGHKLFILIMAKVRGKEPNYLEFWKRNHLPNYSLRCVYNSTFSKNIEE